MSSFVQSRRYWIVAGVALLVVSAGMVQGSDLFSTSAGSVFDHDMNRMWSVFGTADGGVVPSQGNEAGWAEWNALKFAWSVEAGELEKLKKLLLTYPVSEDGYVWSWKTEEGWPTHHFRHFDTNSKYILGVWRYTMWQGGKAFLETVDPKEFPNEYSAAVRDVSRGRTVLEKCRLAMGYQLKALLGAQGLLIIPSDTSDGTVAGKPTDYWDNFLFGNKSATANIYFYASLNAMRELEQAFGDPAKADEYSALMAKVKHCFNDTFWDAEKGRYVGCVDVSGRVWDLGFTYLNLEAVTYGLASRGQAEQIFKWLDGGRIIQSDIQTVAGKKTGVTGKDIYDLIWAPRSTTKAVEAVPVDGKYWWWNVGDQITVGGKRPSAAYGEHVENGGAIFYVSFYDLMARLKVLGADNSFNRLSAIMGEFAKDELQRDPKNNVGASWKWGLIGEFPESGLIPTFLIHGYLGLSATADGVVIQPDLPAKLMRLSLNQASWHGHPFSVAVERRDESHPPCHITFQSLGKTASAFRVVCKNLVPGHAYRIRVNGDESMQTASTEGVLNFELEPAMGIEIDE